LSALMPNSQKTLFYKSNKEKQLDGREIIVPSGGTLGGGSSINLMMYSRGQRCDFDSWKTPGWSADEMLPYLKKMETYHGPDPKDVHGLNGPIDVSNGTYRASVSVQDYIQAAEKVGYPEIEDLGALDTNNGIQRAKRYIGLDGKRQDVASQYIRPRLESGKHTNLHIIVNSRVNRVLFDGKKASGIEFRPVSNSNVDAPLRSVRGKKMVIVSCGALGTPSVLERSGVGNPSVLHKAGVQIVTEIPGVGEGLQDHHLLTYSYRSNLDPSDTIDALVGGRLDPVELIKQNDPILGWNALDTTCKLRPTDTEVKALGLSFQAAWDREFKHNPNKPLVLGSLVSGFPGDPTSVPDGQYLTQSMFTAYPKSRGSIHITGPGLNDPLDFTTGFFADPDGTDIKKHVWAYKMHREIFRRMNAYRGELAMTHPPFPPTSNALCGPVHENSLKDIRNIEYSADDDRIIEGWLRKNVGTTWHSLGTCKMASLDAGGVVNSSLSVHGVESLKVVDLSIPPENVATNTMSTAVAIGEKAADIVIQELGLHIK
ncbi:GMC oxidoreductase-domain-containing protein, partial [Dendryphion nanum]